MISAPLLPISSSPRKVTLREAALEDLPAVVAMGQQFLQSTSYRDLISENPVQMTAMATLLIDSSTGLLLVAEQADELLGMIGMLVMDHPLSGERIASELFWWVDPVHRGSLGMRLLKQAEDWARAQGVVTIMLAAPDAAVGRIYERLGYRQVELAYARNL